MQCVLYILYRVHQKKKVRFVIVRCSFGGGLSRLTGLAQLSEISLSFRIKMCSYESARLSEVSVDLGKISPRRDENFRYDSGRRDGIL